MVGMGDGQVVEEYVHRRGVFVAQVNIDARPPLLNSKKYQLLRGVFAPNDSQFRSSVFRPYAPGHASSCLSCSAGTSKPVMKSGFSNSGL